MKATLASIALSCSDRSRLRFHLLDDGLTDDDRASLVALAATLGLAAPLHFLSPDLNRIAARAKSYCGGHTAYTRLLLCEILPDVDWVIYSDVDILWFADICDLWRERDEALSILWARDILSIAKDVGRYSVKWNPAFDPSTYACSGMTVMNLRRMRERGFVAWCYAFIGQHAADLYFADQEVLNALPATEKRLVHQRWNCMNPCREALEGVVLHFNGIGAYWKNPRPFLRPLYAIWYEFAARALPGEVAPIRLPFWKRTLFALMGCAYPSPLLHRLIETLLGDHKADQICRQLFFAWLRLRRGKAWSRSANG